MTSRKKLLEKSSLYCIIDRKVYAKIWPDLEGFIYRIKNAGVDLIQYRDKTSAKASVLNTARRIKKVLTGCKTLFIVNDYLDVAKISGADGVHLGQDDVTVKTARRILGKDKIIGLSSHSLKQARNAAGSGSDYISLGPVYKTATKPEYKPMGLGLIKKASRDIKIPFFAIGGINTDNIKKVRACGVKRVAVCRAICQADNPESTIRTLKLY